MEDGRGGSQLMTFLVYALNYSEFDFFSSVQIAGI